ncbi:MAG: J domain-containing protein [Spirochaetota bacterium]
MATATTYYDILNVEANCSQEEIKRAFRKRAKELHPDVHNGDGNVSVDEMRNVLKAYETLGNPARRALYDRTHYIVHEKYRFDYREFLKAQKTNLKSQSKLIFFDLLHSREDDAIELFARLCEYRDFDLRDHLDREDYMDCTFLLAEEYEDRGDFLEAYRLLRRLVICESERPYFRHFLEEVTEKLKSITCFKMIENEQPETVLECLEELISFDFSRKDTAFFLKKAAEIYSERGEFDRAIRYLRQGLKLDDKMTGIKKLKQKIGYRELD